MNGGFSFLNTDLLLLCSEIAGGRMKKESFGVGSMDGGVFVSEMKWYKYLDQVLYNARGVLCVG